MFQDFFKRKYAYDYIGINQSNNQVVRGTILAGSDQEARRKLSLRRIKVNKLTRQSKRTNTKKIKFKNIIIFSRQMSTMLKSGIPLLRSLEIIADGNTDIVKMKNLVLDIRNDVSQGMSLSSALSKHNKYFDKLYCGLIEAGEIAGTLDIMFDNIGNYQERVLNIKRKVIGALTYPIIVIIVAISAVILILLFILPKFQEMYDSLGISLPFITQLVIKCSKFLYSYGFLIIVFITALYLLFKNRLKKSLKFRERIDLITIKIPILGKIVRDSLISRWGSTLSILTRSGIPLINSLDLVANSMGNLVYDKSTKNIKSKVNQGESLTNSMGLELDYLFPIMFVQMCGVGEESGTLDHMLEKSSIYYEEEVNSMVSILSTLIEPFIIIILGIIIGIMVFAMYAPLWSIGGS